MESIVRMLDVSRDLEQVRRLHAFLLPHFGTTELEPLAYYEAQAISSSPVRVIMLLGVADGVPVCGSISDLLPLPGEGRVLAAIGHALVSSTMRGRGLGRRLAAETDSALARCADALGKRVEAYILESEAEARVFWSRQGYRWPDQMRFFQPPLAYKPDGTPALPHVPLFLMVRHAAHPTAIPAGLLREYAGVLLGEWYRSEIPDQVSDPAACRRATDWFDETILAPVLRSIVGDPVRLRDLESLSNAESAQWLQAI